MKRNTIRRIIQAGATAISNGYVKGFATGKIYTGNSKMLCSPGMNCYSCPGATMSCPIGALQAVLGNRNYRISLYVIGMLFVFGTVLGRGICGFLCPFGLIQDILYKIPFVKKIRELPAEKILRKLKYIILIVFVLCLSFIAVDATGMAAPNFCKYICPVGSLEGGVILVLLNEGLRSACGFLYTCKLLILAIILIGSIIVYRPFCRYMCPLGAIYGIFNRFAWYRYNVDEENCSKCKKCQRVCEFNIAVYKNPNSVDCIRCGACIEACDRECIKSKFSPLTTEKNNKKME